MAVFLARVGSCGFGKPWVETVGLRDLNFDAGREVSVVVTDKRFPGMHWWRRTTTWS